MTVPEQFQLKATKTVGERALAEGLEPVNPEEVKPWRGGEEGPTLWYQPYSTKDNIC